MAEKKKEKRKKGKKESVLETYVDIQKHLSFAENIQRTIMQSSIGMKALAESAKSLQIKQVTNSLQAISGVQNTIREMALRQASVVQVLQASPAIRALAQYQKNVQNLIQNYVAINKLIEVPKISIPLVTAKIDNIPSETNNVVQSLLRHVDYLEREISKKEKENKVLRRILSELKKKLKTSYVV